VLEQIILCMRSSTRSNFINAMGTRGVGRNFEEAGIMHVEMQKTTCRGWKILKLSERLRSVIAEYDLLKHPFLLGLDRGSRSVLPSSATMQVSTSRKWRPSAVHSPPCTAVAPKSKRARC